MSKILNLLKKAQNRKDPSMDLKRGIDREAATSQKDVSAGLAAQRPSQAFTAGSDGTQKLLATVFIVCVILLALNIAFFLMTKNYAQRTNEALAKISAIELALDKRAGDTEDLSITLAKISTILENLTFKVDKLNTSVKDLWQERASQTFAIETLTKAKNTLFNRMNELELKLDQAKEPLSKNSKK